MELMDVNIDEFLNTDIESKTKIKDIGKANRAFRKLVDIEMKMKEIEDLAKAELDRINNWKKKELEGLQDDKNYFDFQLEQYYREQREIDPSFKLSTPYGKVTSRKQPPSWKYEDEKVIEDLKKKGFMNLVRVKTVEEVEKAELKKSVEILKDVVSLNGVIVKNIKPYIFQEGIFVDENTGEIKDVEDYKYHDRVIVCKGQVIEGVTIEERDDTVTVKAVL